MIGELGEQGQLAARGGPHPAHDEPAGAGLWRRTDGRRVSATAAPSWKYGIAAQADSSMAAMAEWIRPLWSLAVIEKRTSALVAGVDDVAAVEAGVGPQHQRSGGRPAERTRLNVSVRNPAAPRPAWALPPRSRAVDDIAGAGDHREQRVVAADMVVRELGPALLGQPIGLADTRVDINSDRHLARADARRPSPAPAARRPPGPADGHGPS